MAGLLGPGSVTLEGFFKVLIAPCGGTSGLPYDWARVPGRGCEARRRCNEEMAAGQFFHLKLSKLQSRAAPDVDRLRLLGQR
jgi:hypothetical protein